MSCFVAAREYEPVDLGVDRDIDEILQTHHVCLDRLDRIVFSDVDMFHRHCVDDDVDLLYRPSQSIFVPDVTR